MAFSSHHSYLSAHDETHSVDTPAFESINEWASFPQPTQTWERIEAEKVQMDPIDE